jgi:hypothetical protein
MVRIKFEFENGISQVSLIPESARGKALLGLFFQGNAVKLDVKVTSDDKGVVTITTFPFLNQATEPIINSNAGV